MKLNNHDEEILSGKFGKAKQKAIEILIALGKIYEAEKLIPVDSVQVSGVSYKNLGEAGLQFLNEWAMNGAKVEVPTMLNPAGMDLKRWEKIGFSQNFAKKQLKVIDAFNKFDISPICTCVPYLAGNLPRFGTHIAWAESSAVSFANSVLGARTNREGGPSALASAIIGKTPYYGLHIEKNRMADYLVKVKCDLHTEADFGALGYIIGKQTGNAIPYFEGIKSAGLLQLRSLGAAMAASGAVALYHIHGITPEAIAKNMISKEYKEIVVNNLEEGYKNLNSQVEEIDMVSFGCPHASFEEIKRIASLLAGKKVKTKLWITTATPIYYMAKQSNLKKIIEKAGGTILTDTCMIVAPINDFNIKSLATNSAKAACYAPHHCGVKVRYANLEKCIEIALTGRYI